METFYQQLINLFLAPPGNLVYHMVLIFAVTAAQQGIFIHRRSGQRLLQTRALFGLGLILAMQGVLFIASGLAWQGLANPHVILPPLDRAAAVFSLLWIVWLWLFPLPLRLADALTGLLSAVIAIGFFFTLAQWGGQPPSMAFNGTVFDVAWEIGALAIILIGLLALIVRRPPGWGMGFGFLLLNLAGHSVQLISPGAGDFSGVVRLAQLCSFPLLPALAQRLVTPGATGEVQPGVQFKIAPQKASYVKETEPGVMRERRRYSADPRAVQAWLDVAAQANSARLVFSVTRAVAQTMLADICFYLTDSGPGSDLNFEIGYDLIREDEIPGITFPRDTLPALGSALQRGRTYRLEPGSSTPDLKTLGERFGLKQLGSLLFIPLVGIEKKPAGFLLLSPYSDRSWTLEDQNYFTAAVEPLANLLQRIGEPHTAPPVQNDAAVIELRLQLQQAQQETQQLQADLTQALQQAARQDVQSLMALQSDAHPLSAENEHLRAAGADRPAAQEVDYLEQELRDSLKEIAHLQNKLAESQMKMAALQKQTASPAPTMSEEREVIASMAQELRQPMASVVGYTDLLLSESAGILGALQRKFLDRVKISIDRMHTILDDLVQITTPANSEPTPTTQVVQASVAIDQALEQVRAQLQEKNIVLQVDLPEELPEIQADPDAVQQILEHLLQNAGSASPQEGTILLKARIDRHDAAAPYLLFQITDSGGGIAQADLPKVFARRYRAEHALIEGVGDTGVGLSIAKTLTEAQGGHIWVESEPGQSATFSVLLPVRPLALLQDDQPTS